MAFSKCFNKISFWPVHKKLLHEKFVLYGTIFVVECLFRLFVSNLLAYRICRMFQA